MVRVMMASVALIAVGTAWAQQPAARPAAPAVGCEGQVVTMRVSRLTANGTLAGFTAAAKAQQAWYASKGHKQDRVVVAPIVESGRPSQREFVTLLIRPTAAPQPPRDAAWSDFVSKYKANSYIDSEARFCLPKSVRIAG